MFFEGSATLRCPICLKFRVNSLTSKNEFYHIKCIWKELELMLKKGG